MSSSLPVITCPVLDLPRAHARDTLDIKSAHTTAAHKLYAWPKLQRFAPNLDMNYPIFLEVQRPSLSQETAVPRCLSEAFGFHTSNSAPKWYDAMSLSQTRQLTGFYFNESHTLYPVLDKSTFTQANLGKFVEDGLSVDGSSCITMLLFAIGSFAAYHHGFIEWAHNDTEDIGSPVGIGFYNEARKILTFLPKGRVETAQCHLLAG